MKHDDDDEGLPVGDVSPLTRRSVLQRAGWVVAAAAFPAAVRAQDNPEASPYDPIRRDALGTRLIDGR